MDGRGSVALATRARNHGIDTTRPPSRITDQRSDGTREPEMKTLKPLSTKNPPAPVDDHKRIDEWIAYRMPVMNPIVAELDRLICKHLADPRFAIKWGKAYYGSARLGWCIELAAYHVSVNVVFLNGSQLQKPPALGSATRYVKVRTLEDARSTQLRAWMEQSCRMPGWAW